MDEEVKHFFISYNKADRAWAVWIAWVLEEAKYNLVIQDWDVQPPDNFVFWMNQAIEKCERTVAVLSPDYLKGPFPQSELAAAFADDPMNEKGRLVFVRVRECELKGLFKPIVYIDLVGKGEEEAKQTLLDRIQRVRAKPLTKPEFPGTVPRSVPERPEFPGDHSTAPASQEEAHEAEQGGGSRGDGKKVKTNSASTKWKPYAPWGLAVLGLGLAVGSFVLGFILASILASREKPKPANNACPEVNATTSLPTALIIASGTVYAYLTAADPCLTVSLINKKKVNAQLLQGPTGPAAMLFGHVFYQDPQAGSENPTILVMSARKLKHSDLSRLEPGQLEEGPDEGKRRKPEYVYEVYLGPDTYEMLLVNGDGDYAQDKRMPDFTDILEACTLKNGVKKDEYQLEFANLRKIQKWVTGEYRVYVGTPESATRKLWKEKLGEAFPSKVYVWDIQNNGAIDDASAQPNIYLGSTALLNLERDRRGIKNYSERITMLESGQPARRGLYMYGWVNHKNESKHPWVDPRDNKMHPDTVGYDLTKAETEIIKYVLDLLGEKELLTPECIQKQKTFFNLGTGQQSSEDSKVGWIHNGNPADHIFRVDSFCGQPKEPDAPTTPQPPVKR